MSYPVNFMPAFIVKLFRRVLPIHLSFPFGISFAATLLTTVTPEGYTCLSTWMNGGGIQFTASRRKRSSHRRSCVQKALKFFCPGCCSQIMAKNINGLFLYFQTIFLPELTSIPRNTAIQFGLPVSNAS